MRKKKKLGKKFSVIGFDLGGTKLASGVVTSEGKILAMRKDPVQLSLGPQAFIDALSDVALQWKRQYPQAVALGIASCGPLNPEKGILLQPTNFPRWGNLNLSSLLRKKVKLPVFMQNDAAAAAAAEGWAGGAKKLKNWMTLTLGTGLGTGIVMQRQIFLGGSGLGPEAGHMMVTDKPYACGCGNLGCAEAVLSGSALHRRLAENAPRWKAQGLLQPRNTFELVERARKGELVSTQIFQEYAHVLARCVHNYAVMFSPSSIFFAGGLSEASDLFLEQAAVEAEKLLQGRPGFLPKLLPTKLGKNLGVLAGAWVCLKGLDLEV